MKKYKLIFKGIFVIILLVTDNKVTNAQEVLDVLPVSGRNELFHNYLMASLDTLVEKRRLLVEESLNSVDNLQARQKQLKQDYVKLVGELPEKTPLNPVVVATLERDGYNIDKVYYESRPNHHVTANFYYPTIGTGPFPGILVTCGHYPVAKSIELLQQLCILLTTNGFAVLIVDPIGQGERVQIVSPVTGNLYFIGESGTSEHSRLDVGSVINGTSVMAYELWDNHRSIDYLYTRPEVDTTKIGCAGSSGGGAQATYLDVMDERIDVTVIDSYIMNEQTLFSTIGPQTGSQNLSYEGVYGIDHPDFITMFAPKPFMITASTQDFFDIGATKQTYSESQEVYNLLGDSNNIGYFESIAEHGLNKPKREATTKWFRTWFYSDSGLITEPDFSLLDYNTLRVTQTGQVYTNFENEKTVTDINVHLADEYSSNREAFWANNSKDSCLKMVKSLIKFNENHSGYIAEIVDTIDRGHYTVEKIKIIMNNQVPVTGLLFTPKVKAEMVPAVLYVDGQGKKSDAAEGGLIEKVFVDSGKVVFAIDLRGFGETSDNPAMNEGKHGNVEHRNAVISLYIGKTLIGQRVEDIMTAMDYLLTRVDVDPEKITIEGIGRAATSVLHASAIDSRFSSVVVRNADSSWMDIIKFPTKLNNMTHVIPSSMMYYDLSNLVDAISPVKVSYNPPAYVITEPVNIGEKSINKNILQQNFPNPFKNNTQITYTMNEPAYVSLIVFDILGKIICRLVDENQTANTYQVQIGKGTLQQGIYFYQLLMNGIEVDTKKMVVIL